MVIQFTKLYREEQKVLNCATVPEIDFNEARKSRVKKVRRFMREAGPVTRVYLEHSKKQGRYYTAQYHNYPEKLIASLKKIGFKKVVVLNSRIGWGGTTLLFPDDWNWGFRVKVYF